METTVPADPRQARLPANFAADFEPVLRQRANLYRQSFPVRRYRRCYATHSGIGLRRLRPLKETLFDNAPKASRRHFHGYALYKYFTERRVALDIPNLVLLHNHWSAGYHHWVTEALVKAQFVDPLRSTVVLPRDYPPFARESLEMLGFETLEEIPPDRGIRAEWLTIVPNPYSGHYDPEHLSSLRRRFTSRSSAGDTAAPAEGRSPAERDWATADGERLYITRSAERIRRVENEDEVVAALEGYGFTAVDTRALTFAEQIVRFGRCATLVSVHGAGLTNCLFMPPSGAVLELSRALTAAAPTMNSCYWHLASASGLEYYYQFCHHGRNNGEHIDRVNVIVDIDKLRRNVELMLSADTTRSRWQTDHDSAT